MMAKGKKYVSWKQVNKFVTVLSRDLELQRCIAQGEVKSVYGIPRGGLCLAVMISHKLKLPLDIEPRETSLIVDDISDTGDTLLKFKDHKVATMFWHKLTRSSPDFSLYEKKGAWIVFPWELEP
jgi:hypoxanthine phosphoribosyltransferase